MNHLPRDGDTVSAPDAAPDPPVAGAPRASNGTAPAPAAEPGPVTRSPEVEAFMRMALAEARAAAEAGDVPVGAVLVDGAGQVLALGRNRREVNQDPTAHAEIEALRAAARARDDWHMNGCTLFVTMEPCPMCAGALVNARVARLVYGCADLKAGAVDTLFSIGRDARLNHRFDVTGGVLADECAAVLRAFFAERRKAGPRFTPGARRQ